MGIRDRLIKKLYIFTFGATLLLGGALPTITFASDRANDVSSQVRTKPITLFQKGNNRAVSDENFIGDFGWKYYGHAYCDVDQTFGNVRYTSVTIKYNRTEDGASGSATATGKSGQIVHSTITFGDVIAWDVPKTKVGYSTTTTSSSNLPAKFPIITVE